MADTLAGGSGFVDIGLLGLLDEANGDQVDQAELASRDELEELTQRSLDLFDDGQFAEASLGFQAALKRLAPDDDQVWWYQAMVGEAAFAAGDYPQAYQQFSAIVKRGVVDKATVWLRLGQANVECGRATAATACFQRAEQLGGEHVWQCVDAKYRL